jgi:hypothetical protein
MVLLSVSQLQTAHPGFAANSKGVWFGQIFYSLNEDCQWHRVMSKNWIRVSDSRGTFA